MNQNMSPSGPRACIYIYIYILCVYIYIYMYIICIISNICVICIMCVYIYIHIHAATQIHRHTDTYIHTYVRTYIHTCMHADIHLFGPFAELALNVNASHSVLFTTHQVALHTRDLPTAVRYIAPSHACLCYTITKYAVLDCAVLYSIDMI